MDNARILDGKCLDDVEGTKVYVRRDDTISSYLTKPLDTRGTVFAFGVNVLEFSYFGEDLACGVCTTTRQLSKYLYSLTMIAKSTSVELNIDSILDNIKVGSVNGNGPIPEKINLREYYSSNFSHDINESIRLVMNY